MTYHYPEVNVLSPNLAYFAELFYSGDPRTGISQRSYIVPKSIARLGFEGMNFVVPKDTIFTPEAAARYYTSMLGRRLERVPYLLPDQLPCLQNAIRVTIRTGLFPTNQVERVFSLTETGLPYVTEQNLGFVNTRTAYLHPRDLSEQFPEELYEIAVRGAMMREKLM